MKNGKPKSFQKRPHGKPARGAKPFGDKKKFGDKHGDKKRGDTPRGEKHAGLKREERSGQPRREERGGQSRRDERGNAPRRDERVAAPRRDERAPSPRREERIPAPRRQEGAASPRLGGTLLWGFHAVRAAWLNPKRHIQRLILTDAAREQFEETLADTSSGRRRPAPEILDKNILERMMPPGAVHQGIVAAVDNLELRDAHDLAASLGADDEAIVLILDQVTDPHNVGAILRSAAAFGAHGVIMQDRHAPELAGVLAKTASGAADVIAVAAETNLSRAIEMLQENGFVVAGLDERGTPIGEMKKHKRVALVLGAEGAGLRRLVAEHCDELVCLPTQGAIRSLNVSNAAAVALYALKTL